MVLAACLPLSLYDRTSSCLIATVGKSGSSPTAMRKGDEHGTLGEGREDGWGRIQSGKALTPLASGSC